MKINGSEAEKKALIEVAGMMCLAARTAPKGKGVDLVETLVVTGEEELKVLSEEMWRMHRETGAGFIARDADNILAADSIVFVATKVQPLGVPGCGYCGFKDCAEMQKKGGICALSAGDLGIAIGSAVAVAARHHVDNRIMYSVGKAALNLGWFSPEVRIAYGIPLSAKGKNPFFDRASKR